MKALLWVGLGGFAGACARYLSATWLATHAGSSFPYGTLAVNLAGSFLLGLFLGGAESVLVSPTARLTIAIGFLGAFTTFSTWTYETVRLIEEGSLLLALGNAMGSLLAGLLAVIAGLAAGRAL